MRNYSIITFITFLISIAFGSTLIGQKIVDQHEFVGTIQLIDKSIISYKISFDEYETGEIEGISITDFSGNHRTESKITGNLDREENTISFNEISNLTTKSDMPSGDFCYIHIYNAKIKTNDKKGLVQGHFYSRYADGKKCIEGDIYLMSDNYFYKKMKSLSNKRLLPKENKVLIKKMITESRESTSNTVLKKDDKLTILAKGDNLMVRVWEDEYLDGDRVSVYKNDKAILKNYLIKASQKQLLVPITEDTTTLRIVAENEGRLPPNSANFIILNSETEVPIKLQLNEGNEVTIQILRAKQ